VIQNGNTTFYLSPALVPLSDVWSLYESLRYIALISNNFDEATLSAEDNKLVSEFTDKIFASISTLVSQLLYLCSTEADITVPNKPSLVPKRPKLLRSVSNPITPTEWKVGARIGSFLRKIQEDYDMQCELSEETGSIGRTVRPHWRRAHWHTYRCGENRAYSLVKWMQPMLVNGSKVSTVDDLPAVVKPV
jgi:hypothetical protein